MNPESIFYHFFVPAGVELFIGGNGFRTPGDGTPGGGAGFCSAAGFGDSCCGFALASFGAGFNSTVF
jgi:hypothetical protein